MADKPSSHDLPDLRGVYTRNAATYDAQRSRRLFERAWLDRFLAVVPPGSTVLDLGCGSGEPIARYIADRGYAVALADFSPTMLALARQRFPGAPAWESDMRALELPDRFGGIIAWDSFFHLTIDDQRQVLPRLARHVVPGGALLLTVGPAEGAALGTVCGEPVGHWSLSQTEYRERLAALGFADVCLEAEDPTCDFHSVLLASDKTTTAEPCTA